MTVRSRGMRYTGLAPLKSQNENEKGLTLVDDARPVFLDVVGKQVRSVTSVLGTMSRAGFILVPTVHSITDLVRLRVERESRRRHPYGTDG